MARRFSFRTTAVLIVVLVLIFVFHGTRVLAPVEHGVVVLLRPVQQFLYGFISPSSRDASSPSIKEFEERITKLVIENARLKEERAQLLAQIGQEGFLQTSGLHGLPVSIIGQSPEGEEQVFVLNRGTEMGVQPGDPVIAEEGLLIGVVKESEAGRSTVFLVTNTQITIGAEVQNPARSPGIVSGQHGLTMRMQFIPQNDPVEKGNVVVTSAIDERIPPGLVIGEITEVHYKVGDLFQEASLRALVDLQRLRYITVLQRP